MKRNWNQSDTTISYLFSAQNIEKSENEKETKKYLNELKEICDLYKFVEEFKKEDPQIISILNSLPYISLSMGKEFVFYLDVLFPFFEEKINADINLIITDNNIQSLIDNGSKVSIVILGAFFEVFQKNFLCTFSRFKAKLLRLKFV